MIRRNSNKNKSFSKLTEKVSERETETSVGSLYPDDDTGPTATSKIVDNPFKSPSSQEFVGGEIPTPLPVVEQEPSQSQFPVPLPVNLPDVALETTQQEVVNNLNTIDESLKEGLQNVIDSYKNQGDEQQENFEDLEEKFDWKALSSSLGEKITDTLRSVFGFVENSLEKAADNLNERARINEEQLQHMKSMDENLGEWLRTSSFQDLRASAKDEAKSKGLRGFLGDSVGGAVPDESNLKKMMNMTGKTILFWHALGAAIGTIGAKALTNILTWAGTGMASSGNAGVARLGNLVKTAATIAGGMAGIISAIATVTIGSAVYSLFKDPSQIGEYIEAFSNIWERNVIPTLKWLATEIMPPVALAFGALAYATDVLATSVGDNVNDILIYTIGTLIPEVLAGIGNIIKDSWNTIISLGGRILGMMGIGRYADQGIIGNFLGLFTDLYNYVNGVIDTALTSIIRALSLDDLFGLEDGESLYGRLNKFGHEELPKFFGELVDDTVAAIQEINPIPMIKERLQGMADAILEMVPTFEDIKSWIRNAIPDWLGPEAKSAVLDLLGLTKTPTTNPEEMNQGALNALDKVDQIGIKDVTGVPSKSYQDTTEIDPPQSQSNVNIFAPNNTTNNQSSVVNGGGGNNGGGYPSTRPEKSNWDRFLHNVD